MCRYTFRAVLGFAALVLLLATGGGTGAVDAAHPMSEGGAKAFSIDLDPFGDVANTATSLGSREECASVAPNGVQDGDEDAIDAIALDVTVTDIPETHPMIGFTYELRYDDSVMQVTSHDPNFLLAATSGSSLFDASEPVPDTRVNGRWTGAALDLSTGAGPAPEFGTGVLGRIQLTVSASAGPGLYVLHLNSFAHIDPLNEARVPADMQAAMIAVGMPCPEGPDSDGDGVNDIDEIVCGGDPLDGDVKPELLGNGVDDNGNGLVDEGLTYNETKYFDCDGDGYAGYVERHVYGQQGSLAGANQIRCGTAVPGWPADIVATGLSANRVDIMDMSAFLTPVRLLDTSAGDPDFDIRFDLVPDNRIDILDLGSLTALYPPMLGGERALNGPPCPLP